MNETSKKGIPQRDSDIDDKLLTMIMTVMTKERIAWHTSGLVLSKATQ